LLVNKTLPSVFLRTELEFVINALAGGNVLVNSTSDAELKYKLNGETLKLPSNGVKGCIIDFTLARILGDKGQPVYLDLGDDEEQFLGNGV